MPTRPTSFDYGVLLRDDADIARQAAEEWRELVAVELRATNGWLEKGRFLARVWAALGHGHRLGWLKHETGLTEKTAERYIAAYELMLPHVDFDNLSNLPKLERSAVYELCGDVPEDIARTFIPRVLEGERGLRRQILQAIEALKPDVAAPAPAVDEADPVGEPDAARTRDERAFRFTGALSGDARAVVAETLRLIREGVPLDDLDAGLNWDDAAPEIEKDAIDLIIDQTCPPEVREAETVMRRVDKFTALRLRELLATQGAMVAIRGIDSRLSGPFERTELSEDEDGDGSGPIAERLRDHAVRAVSDTLVVDPLSSGAPVDDEDDGEIDAHPPKSRLQ